MSHLDFHPRVRDGRSKRVAVIAGVIVGVLATLGWGYFRISLPAASGELLQGPVIPFDADRLRVGTYNIDGGVGTDGKLDLARTAADLIGCDLVGLQEVHGRLLYESRDQCHILGEILRENWLFAPAERQWWHDSFGNGVVCRLPCEHWDRLPISGDGATNHRSILRLDVWFQAKIVHVLIAHMPTTNDRQSQGAIIRSLFLDVTPPALLLGDLNSKPGEPWVESLRHEAGVVDGVGMFGETKEPAHVDWIFARGLVCVGGGALDHGASDHPFYWNEFTLPQTPGH